MEAVFYAVFAAGFVVVLASLGAAAARRVSTGVLLALAGVLAGGAVACAAALGVDLVVRYADVGPVLLATAGLAAAAVAEAGLYALVRARNRLAESERLLAAGHERIASVLDSHAEDRARELTATLARERANASHLLGQQERKLAAERRDAVARQADRARAELARSIDEVQQRLEQRLAAWAADLDRGQRGLESRLNELAQRQAEAIDAYETRLAADSDYLRTFTEEHQGAVARLRAELQRVGRDILEEGRAEIEAHGEERRRGLQEIAGRLRDQERTLRDQVEREQAEALTRVTAAFAEVERRQRENLERALDRAASRLGEDAERRFDAQIRESREKSAQRLARELEKAMDQFSRRAEKEISDRITEAAQAAAARLERRIGELTRAAETQHDIAEERMRIVGSRLNDALAQAEDRIAAFETQIETEVTAKLEQLERSIRTART